MKAATIAEILLIMAASRAKGPRSVNRARAHGQVQHIENNRAIMHFSLASEKRGTKFVF
jgi:hypothetical protein